MALNVAVFVSYLGYLYCT